MGLIYVKTVKKYSGYENKWVISLLGERPVALTRWATSGFDKVSDQWLWQGERPVALTRWATSGFDKDPVYWVSDQWLW